MASVTFADTTRFYAGVDTPAVDSLNLEVADGEFVVLVGPSGCGKSTTLRMLAGLEGVDGGKILIGDKDVTHVAPKDRDIAMVFQNYALYPHMTVAENIGFHLKLAKLDKAEIVQRVSHAAGLLDLTDYLSRMPAKLSGGQRQRVAMGRAIVRRPDVFLMDEPLSNLDAKLRVQTRAQISSLQRRLGVTTLYVTHDQVEAMTMGDRVAVLNGGVLQQVDTPSRLFARPVNIFVAGFIGSPAMNLIQGQLDGAEISLPGFGIQLNRDQIAALSSPEVVVGLRPEAFKAVPAGAPGHGLQAVVEVVEELGSDQYLYCTPSLHTVSLDMAEFYDHEQAQGTLTVRSPGLSPFARGDKVLLRPDIQAVHLFDARTGGRLPD